MGTTAVYLIPDLGDVAPTEYARRVKTLLSVYRIINAEPAADYPDIYPPGAESLAPFSNDVGWGSGFEHCIIYGSSRVSVVPTDPAVFPHCPACSADVSDAYYETINDAVEFEPEKPDNELRVRCPNCGGEYRLDQLVDDTGIFLVNAYVDFDDVPGSVRREWLDDFESRLGLKHRCLEYWYT